MATVRRGTITTGFEKVILIKLLKSKRYEPALLIDTPHVVRSDTASTSRGRGNADGKDVTWSNTHLKAGEQILLSSGGDTTLKGAVVQAPRIDAQVGGNLLIQSLQDTSTYTSQQKSSGGSITVGTTGVSGSVNAGKSNINSQYTSVTEQ
ncbi:MAG: hemagglutinin repeat-containing protein, partial [Burkholderiales bacterium]|nr:hemagglutinin repeat-containing protein [Burkholderiales bacterium]